MVAAFEAVTDTRAEGIVIPAARACSKNENVLAGVSCPKCGNEDELRVLAEVVVNVTDDGSDVDEDSATHTWGDDSWTMCPACEHEGQWKGFSHE